MKPDFKNLTTVYLHPGEVCYSEKDIVVSTVLGSCISISMYNAAIPFSGISHCQLPTCKEPHNNCQNCKEQYKYVDCTVKNMVQKFNQHGIANKDIELKLFGGADVLQTVSGKIKINTVGSQNINSAIKTISEFNIKIMASDVGGERGRKLFFRSKTGEVFLNRLKKNEKN